MATNSSNTNQQPELTIIGRETKISGEMHFEAGARILGEFDGRISSSGEVQIGDTATCRAQIEADSLVIDGRLEGDAVVCNKLSLNETAAVRGDLRAGTMVVTEGATYVGACAIGPRAEELEGIEQPGPGAEKSTQTEVKPRSKQQAGRIPATAEDDLTPPWKRDQNTEEEENETVTAGSGNGRASKAS